MNVFYKVSLLSVVLVASCSASEINEKDYTKGSKWTIVLSKKEKQQRLE